MSANNDLQITWLGHSTFYVVTPGGKTLLIDPWLSGNPKTPEKYKKGFDQLDYALITHGHSDHFGDAVAVSLKNQPATVANFEIISYLQTKGLKNGIGVNTGGTVTLPGSDIIEVTAVHADHSSSIQDGETTVNGGEAIGFVIKFENGYTIYNTGDTAVFGDMKIISEIYKPDLLMLPIGDHYTMGPKEAAYAVNLVNVSKVLPMHYGTFPLLTGTPEKLRELLAGKNIEVLSPEVGETITISTAE
jgi:L-ascorbate metabolism protein UlaG (beta-lactamase superfamily)